MIKLPVNFLQFNHKKYFYFILPTVKYSNFVLIQ